MSQLRNRRKEKKINPVDVAREWCGRDYDPPGLQKIYIEKNIGMYATFLIY